MSDIRQCPYCGHKDHISAMWPDCPVCEKDADEGFNAELRYRRNKMHEVCAEIIAICKEYRKQRESGFVDSPGGLEHMGDVWFQIEVWADLLTPPAPLDILKK